MPLLICRYGAHLSKEQVAEIVAPHPDTLELVNSWLEYNGVPPSSISMTHGGSWLTLAGVPVSQANELLGASYELHRHARTKETIIRTVSYALPVVLHQHVQTVVPTTFFASSHTLQQTPRRRPIRAAAAQAKVASGKLVKALSSREEHVEVKPSDLRWLYKTFAYEPTATDRNKLGIAGYLNQYPNQTDLTTFMTEFRGDAVDATYTVEEVNNGKYDPSHPGFEANLNVQYASAIAYPTPHVYYSNGGETVVYSDGEPAPGDVFLEWFKHVLAQSKIPQTITTSYGTDEKDCPLEYAKALCRLFAVLGARGASVLFGSGDDGVGNGDCKDKDGNVKFNPLFPATCTHGFLSILASSTQAQVQVAHQTAMAFQVPMSPVSAARRINSPKSRRTSPGEASRTFFRAQNTRTKLCPPSSGTSAASMRASTSAFPSVI